MSLKRSLVLALVGLTTSAQSTCQNTIAPQNGNPSVVSGFRAEIVANKLRSPRGILFDSEGGLLVVEQGHGISRLKLTGAGACVRATGDVQKVVEDSSVSVSIRLRKLWLCRWVRSVPF